MATLTKDKNYLVFTNKDNRTYKFDISKGIFYSTKGNPMKTAPVGFASYVNDMRTRSTLVNYMYRKHYNEGVSYADMSKFANILSICDRLDSIGYKNADYWRSNDGDYIFVGENFKAFAKALKEDENLNPWDFRQSFGKIAFLEEIGLKETEYYTRAILDTIWKWSDIFSKKELVYIAYYLSRGVWEYYENVDGYSNLSSSLFENFFRWAKLIDYIPTKDDFFKQYLTVKKNYKVNKSNLDSKAIKVQLDKHKDSWNFEDDTFEIFVPQTCEDFKNEADQQGNCVYSMYLERVVNGNTNVVFIRKKDNPSKSCITCEVENNGHIRQYLAKGNCSVSTDSLEYAFKKAFENHIANTWKM